MDPALLGRPFARPRRPQGPLPPEEGRCWNRRPARIRSTRASDSDPIRSPRRAFSTEETCETTTTLCLGRSRLARLEQHVPRLARPVQVRRQRAHDHGRDARVVEEVVLDHHVGVWVARDGTLRVVLALSRTGRRGRSSPRLARRSPPVSVFVARYCGAPAPPSYHAARSWQGPRAPQQEAPADFLGLSSGVLQDLISEHGEGGLPDWCRATTID